MTNIRTALVVIGRNEARHLAISLPAVEGKFERMIYVDSGSTDGSREIAATAGAEVIELDTSIPFTAARARNAGFDQLGAEIEFVQFIDGDCELIPAYLDQAIGYLQEHTDTAMVCGRRLERYPERSIFNQLCHLEWNTPVGETDYCGGDITVRRDALAQIGGYNPELIAGEDPEICVRLRREGWKIYRINEDMTWHDANITKLSQWWKRQQRTGHAFAEGSHLHGKSAEQHWVRETRSNWFWGGLFFLTLAGAMVFSPWLLLVLLVFPLQAIRLAVNAPSPVNEQSAKVRLMYGLDCFFAKVPEFVGQLRFVIGRVLNKKQSIIEYK